MPKNSSCLQALSHGTRALPGPLALLPSLHTPAVSPGRRRAVLSGGVMSEMGLFLGSPVFQAAWPHALHSAGTSVDTGLRVHGADGPRSLTWHLGVPTSVCGALRSLGCG